MDRQILCDWVHRYNAAGVAGLATGTRPGRPPSLNEVQMAELKELVIKGPDPELHKVVRWRCVDLCEEIARRYSVTVTKGTMGKWLRKLKLTRLQPRPHHPKKVAEAQESFKKNFASLIKNALLGSTAGMPVEIWFQDEARVGHRGWLPYQFPGAGGSSDALSGRAGGRRRRHPPSTMAGGPFLIVVTDNDARVLPEALRAHLLEHVPKWWLPDAIAFAQGTAARPDRKVAKGHTPPPGR